MRALAVKVIDHFQERFWLGGDNPVQSARSECLFLRSTVRQEPLPHFLRFRFGHLSMDHSSEIV